MKIHLVTYGDINYRSQRENFRDSAKRSGFFDEIIIFTEQDLDKDFRTQFQEVFKCRRGGGYWIWKPYIIKKALDQIAQDDVLIYCDAGCMINANGRLRYEQYLADVVSDSRGVAAFQLRFPEYEYTKKEIFEYFDATEDLMDSKQNLSGIILLRKSPHAQLIIDSWLQAVYDDVWLFTDLLQLPQHQDFIENRHDQSIWSMLVKIHGAVQIPDETYFLDFENENDKYPFWAKRLK